MRKLCAWAILVVVTASLMGCGNKEEPKKVEIQTPAGAVKAEVK